MTTLRVSISAILGLIVFLCAQCPAAEKDSMLSGFSAGIGGSIITNEYKDMHGNVTALPLLGYEGEYLYLRGVAGGIHLFRNEWQELNGQLSYQPQHFYAGDSGDWAMRQLDNRYSTLMGGFNGRITSEYGVLNAGLSTDLLGYSNGILIDASYSYPINMDTISIVPALGLQWNDANYNRYYYGIDHDEANRSGLEYYDPEGSFSPYAQLSGRLNFDANWSLFASAKAMLLNQEIYDSPMVEASEKYAFSLGMIYKF